MHSVGKFEIIKNSKGEALFYNKDKRILVEIRKRSREDIHQGRYCTQWWIVGPGWHTFAPGLSFCNNEIERVIREAVKYMLVHSRPIPAEKSFQELYNETERREKEVISRYSNELISILSIAEFSKRMAI